MKLKIKRIQIKSNVEILADSGGVGKIIYDTEDRIYFIFNRDEKITRYFHDHAVISAFVEDCRDEPKVV